MDKENVINLLERFEGIEIEKGIKHPNITMTLEITANSYGRFEHYIYAKDNRTDISLLCHIKGFPKLTNTTEIEAFGDIVKVLEVAKDEQHLYVE